MSPIRSSRSQAKRSRPPRKTAASRAPSLEESGEFRETPPIISSEEKHQLILAHANARAPKDPLQRVTLWAGVAIAFGAILVGWVFTVGYDVKNQFANGGNADIDAMTERLNAFTQTVEENPLLQKRAAFPSPTSEAAAAKFESYVKAYLGATSSEPVRDDLIAPTPSATTSSAAEEAAPAFNPTETQGLEPAE